MEKPIQETTSRGMEVVTGKMQETINTGEEMQNVIGSTTMWTKKDAAKAKSSG
jgi:hypothetical protein